MVSTNSLDMPLFNFFKTSFDGILFTVFISKNTALSFSSSKEDEAEKIIV
jgi:hypothetical protein